MNKANAIRIVKKYWPCNHSVYEFVGSESHIIKCHACQNEIEFKDLEKAQQKYDEFDEAIQYLLDNLPGYNPVAKDVVLGTILKKNAKGEILQVLAYSFDNEMELILRNTKTLALSVEHVNDIFELVPTNGWQE